MGLKSSRFVFAGIASHEHAKTLRECFRIFCQLERRKPGTRRRTIGNRLPVERETNFVALSVLLFFIKALAGLISQPAALEHGADKWRQVHQFCSVRLREVRDHMGQNIDAHHVRQPEAASPRPSQGRASEHVHFFDGEALLLHEFDGLRHDEDADPVCYEVGRIAGIDDCLAETAVGKVGYGGNRLRIGLRCRDDFEQSHVARRIEEMRAEPGTAEFRRQTGRDATHGQAACIGGEDDAGLEVRCDFDKKLPLDFQILGDGFDHPVAFVQERQVVVEVSGLDEADCRRVIECGRLGAGQRLQG